MEELQVVMDIVFNLIYFFTYHWSVEHHHAHQNEIEAQTYLSL
jgi:hypothetical protein